MDRNARTLGRSKNKYEDAIGLDNNLKPIKVKYKFNSNNEIIL